MRTGRPDYLWWTILAVPLAAGMLALDCVYDEKMDSVCFHFRMLLHGVDTKQTFTQVFGKSLLFIAPAAVVGWFGQRLLVRCGLRLTGKPKEPEAADYDDKPPPAG